jgi:hypothetical protein
LSTREPVRPPMDESFWNTFHVWEKQVSEAWTDLIRSPEFVDLMNQQLESWLLLKQRFDGVAQESLQTAQLPTRAEQEQILCLIHELENQVEELAERVDRIHRLVARPDE